jgi:hypothetical protein
MRKRPLETRGRIANLNYSGRQRWIELAIQEAALYGNHDRVGAVIGL